MRRLAQSSPSNTWCRPFVLGHRRRIDARAAAVLSYLFLELEPALIARCVREAGSDLRRANEFYKETLADKLPRNPRWEEAIAHLI
jgi:hypothetical protein